MCGDDCGGPGTSRATVDRMVNGSGVWVQTGKYGSIAWVDFDWIEAEKVRAGIARAQQAVAASDPAAPAQRPELEGQKKGKS